MPVTLKSVPLPGPLPPQRTTEAARGSSPTVCPRGSTGRSGTTASKAATESKRTTHRRTRTNGVRSLAVCSDVCRARGLQCRHGGGHPRRSTERRRERRRRAGTRRGREFDRKLDRERGGYRSQRGLQQRDYPSRGRRDRFYHPCWRRRCPLSDSESKERNASDIEAAAGAADAGVDIRSDDVENRVAVLRPAGCLRAGSRGLAGRNRFERSVSGGFESWRRSGTVPHHRAGPTSTAWGRETQWRWPWDGGRESRGKELGASDHPLLQTLDISIFPSK